MPKPISADKVTSVNMLSPSLQEPPPELRRQIAATAEGVFQGAVRAIARRPISLATSLAPLVGLFAARIRSGGPAFETLAPVRTLRHPLARRLADMLAVGFLQRGEIRFIDRHHP